MLARLAAVNQNLDRIPTRLLQRIPQDWHAFKGSFQVDSVGKRLNRGC